MPTIKLPTAVGHLAEYRLRGAREFPCRAAGPFNRVAYAAAFEQARQAGVEALAYRCRITPQEVALDTPVPVTS